MEHYSRDYCHPEQIIRVPEVLPFGIVLRCEAYLSPYPPVPADVCRDASVKMVGLPGLLPGGEFQHVHRIISGTSRHGAAHVFSGKVLE